MGKPHPIELQRVVAHVEASNQNSAAAWMFDQVRERHGSVENPLVRSRLGRKVTGVANLVLRRLGA